MPLPMLKAEVAAKMRDLIEPMEGRRILEIGTGWAESATFLSKLKPTWKIYTIDGFGLYGDGRIYERLDHEKVSTINATIARLGNVIQILGDSGRIPWELPIDVLLIDGDHREDPCRHDFLNFSPWVVPGGLVIFDDYTQDNYPLNGVRTVVEEILSSYGIGEIGRDKWDPVYIGYYCAILQKALPIREKYDL